MDSPTRKLEELREAQRLTAELYNARKLDEYFEYLHENVIYNLPIEEGVLIGKTAVVAWYNTYLSQREYVHWQSDPVPTIAGSTGVLSGPFVLKDKRFGESERTLEGEHTVIFAHIEGKWKIGEHMSIR